ncbi:MAG TPA: hypothetical protein VHS80_07485 [Chthoniobacterales bacterium]|jgi:hypothetical protein|nr:hypothetical protein [Chthoniobacterales bacterium]
MKDDGLEPLFELARDARSAPGAPVPEGFAERVAARYRLIRYRERTASRASILSVSVALAIFAAIVGLNLNAITSLGADEQDPADDVAQVLWDSAGN